MSEPTTGTRLHPQRPPRPERATPGAGRRPGYASGPLALAASAAVLGGLLQASPARAIEFDAGEIQGSLDTTISHGMTFRVEKPDDELTDDVNGNDGNLNYRRGIVSNASKFTTDLDVRSGDFGAFFRATGFFDIENRNRERERTPLSDAARDRVGRNLEVLDAYVTGAFDTDVAAVDFRLGKHVLNWGESTFIPGGINAFNAVDVSKLRLPGSELREALAPVSMVSTSIAPNDVLSVEGFYQLDWEETRIDPVGSYFSVTDYVGPGARKAVISHEKLDFEVPDTGCDHRCFIDNGVPSEYARLLLPERDDQFMTVARGADRRPSDGGQWGVAVRHLAESLNDTEFGFYFANHHSRLPLVGADDRNTGAQISGSLAKMQERLGAVGAMAGAAAFPGAFSQELRKTGNLPALQAIGQNPAAVAGIARNPTTGVTALVPALLQITGETNPEAPDVLAAIGAITTAATEAGTTAAAAGAAAAGDVAPQAASIAIDQYVENANYFIQYPEDLRVFGLSFNTQLGSSGWALQGEYSFRPDTPLQLSEAHLFTEGLAPITEALELSGTIAALEARIEQQGNPAARSAMQAQLAALRTRFATLIRTAAPRVIRGYVESDVSQVQATATKLFGPTLGAGGVVFLAELGMMRVHDMPDRNLVPLESPAAGAGADATSWGYRVAARLDYNNAIGGANLHPYAQFLHDVEGNSPAPAGPFVEGRTALTIGVQADYLSRWQADVGYTRYSGEGNELADRDFVSASIKYSF